MVNPKQPLNSLGHRLMQVIKCYQNQISKTSGLVDGIKEREGSRGVYHENE
jgi:hypothetical protein